MEQFVNHMNEYLPVYEKNQTWVVSFGHNDAITIDEYAGLWHRLVQILYPKHMYIIPSRNFAKYEEHLEQLAYDLKDKVTILDFFNGDESDIALLETDLLHLNDDGKAELLKLISEV